MELFDVYFDMRKIRVRAIYFMHMVLPENHGPPAFATSCHWLQGPVILQKHRPKNVVFISVTF